MTSEQARSLLSFLQEQAYTEHRVPPPSEQWADTTPLIEHYRRVAAHYQPDRSAREHRAEAEAFVEELAASRVGPFDDPIARSLLETLANELVAGARAFGAGFEPPEVLYGTMPTGRPVARVERVADTDDLLVIFDKGLFDFADAFTEVWASVVPVSEAPGEVIDVDDATRMMVTTLDRDPALASRLFEAVLAYATGSVASMPPRSSAAHTRLRITARKAAELFVVGHELGHIHAGHLSRTTQPRAVSPRDEPVSPAWKEELDADCHGAELSVMALQHLGLPEHLLPLSFCGPTLALTALAQLEEAVVILALGERRLPHGTPSHPPAAIRKHHVEAFVASRAAQIDDQTQAVVLRAWDHIEVFASVVWERVVPLLVEAHRAGIRPDSRWPPPIDPGGDGVTT